MQNNTAQQAEAKGTAVLDHMPNGWGVIRKTNTQPVGYVWVNNRKSRFGGEYEHALLPEDIANEWQADNRGQRDREGS